jgi:hypothetical protein
MRILIILSLFLYSCKGGYTPAPPANPEGIYQGYDSALYVHDDYSQKMFGDCISVKNVDGKYVFFDKELIPVDNETYTFDYVTPTDYGIGAQHDIRYIRRTGTFMFSYNHLIVEYSVGDTAAGVMSQYKFNGWR